MRVALFVTCITDTLFPRVGEAVVRVLRHFGCQVDFPANQTCCGQPAFNSGFHREARAVARHWLAVFEPHEWIVTPSASCADMVQRHIPELFAGEPGWHDVARRVAARTFEFCTFLRDRLNVDVPALLRFREPVTYHYPCHARHAYSNEELRGWCAGAADLRRPDHDDLCCGFGGVFSVEYADISGAMVTDKLEQLAATGARLVVCNEGGCALQLSGGASRRGLPLRFRHVAECLAESLGLMEPAP